MKTILKIFQNWGLLLLLALLATIFFSLHLQDYLSIKILNHYQSIAQQWTAVHYIQAVCLYLLVYSLLIACTIPCATFFTLVGGFLFGFIAIIYSIFSTTFGGLILLLAVRTAIGPRIINFSSASITRMEQGFKRNAFHYLLMLRLIPIFPCWISNISAGILNVPIKTFILATTLGLIPSTFVYVMAGRGLDKFIAADQTFNFSLLLSPSIYVPLIGLTIISLVPIFYKLLKKSDLKP